MAVAAVKPALDFKETGFSAADGRLRANFFLKANGHDFSLTATVKGSRLESMDLMLLDEFGKKSTLYSFSISSGSAEDLSPLDRDEMKHLGIDPAALWKATAEQVKRSSAAKEFSRHRAR